MPYGGVSLRDAMPGLFKSHLTSENSLVKEILTRDSGARTVPFRYMHHPLRGSFAWTYACHPIKPSIFGVAVS
jgi:hypothetical protein